MSQKSKNGIPVHHMFSEKYSLPPHITVEETKLNLVLRTVTSSLLVVYYIQPVKFWYFSGSSPIWQA